MVIRKLQLPNGAVLNNLGRIALVTGTAMSGKTSVLDTAFLLFLEDTDTPDSASFVLEPGIDPYSIPAVFIRPDNTTRNTMDQIQDGQDPAFENSLLRLLRSIEPAIESASPKDMSVTVNGERIYKCGATVGKILATARAMAMAGHGVLLMDGLETMVAGKTRQTFASWVFDTCLKADIQLIAVTEDMDVLMAASRHVDPEKPEPKEPVVVHFRLEREPGNRAFANRFSGKALHGAVTRGYDIR